MKKTKQPQLGRTRNQATFLLNGKIHHVPENQSHFMAAEYLRTQLGLTGTKIVCAEGDCGACTFIQAIPSSSKKGAWTFRAINSCVAWVWQLDGTALLTIEGLPPQGTPIQKAMHEHHGSQCGFCTPGIIMALTDAANSKKTLQTHLDSKQVSNALTGNLCRCTGYQPIIRAGVSAPIQEEPDLQKIMLPKSQVAELLAIRKIPLALGLTLGDSKFNFFAPTRSNQVDQLLSKETKIIGAGTDLGVLFNKGKWSPKNLVSLHLLNDMRILKFGTKSGKPNITLGASVTLSEVRKALVKKHPEFSNFLDLFASPQIKNAGTLVGNLANASPIGDTLPFLLISGAKIGVRGKQKRVIPIERFFLGYRKTALKIGEWIESIQFELPEPKNKSIHSVVKLYKASNRKDLDISTVSAAFLIETKKASSKPNENDKITEFKCALGGVAATPVRLFKLEKFFLGKSLKNSDWNQAAQILLSEITPLSDLRGSSEFRTLLVKNLFTRFKLELFSKFGAQGGEQEGNP